VKKANNVNVVKKKFKHCNKKNLQQKNANCNKDENIAINGESL
jgi:hypothetical protein